MTAKRKPGRPPLPPELRLSVTVQILVTADEADALYSNARAYRKPMSELVRDVCRRAGLMTRRGLPLDSNPIENTDES